MMVVFQVLLFVLMGFSLVMYYATARYRRKKQLEYGNDERWKSIVTAVTMAVSRYNLVLLFLMVLGFGVTRMFDVDIYINIHNVFGLLLLVLLSGSIVEFIAFRVYDKKM